MKTTPALFITSLGLLISPASAVEPAPENAAGHRAAGHLAELTAEPWLAEWKGAALGEIRLVQPKKDQSWPTGLPPVWRAIVVNEKGETGYLNTAQELGMPPEKQSDLGLGEARSLALYRSWKPADDPDVSQDIRMMVPVFHDVERGMTKVWVVMGVTTQPIAVSYSTPPILEAVSDSQGGPIDLAKVKFECTNAGFDVVYPVMAEIYVTKILDRQEFRALCDKHKTQHAILEHLK